MILLFHYLPNCDLAPARIVGYSVTSDPETFITTVSLIFIYIQLNLWFESLADECNKIRFIMESLHGHAVTVFNAQYCASTLCVNAHLNRAPRGVVQFVV